MPHAWKVGAMSTDAAGRRGEARRAVGAQHALGELLVRVVELVVFVAALFHQLLERALAAMLAVELGVGVGHHVGAGLVAPGGLEARAVLVDEVEAGVQVVLDEVVDVGPALVEQLGVQAVAQPHDDLFVGLALAEGRDGLHGAQRLPPHAHGVALDAHLQRQQDVGEGRGRRGHVRVGHHDELEVHDVAVDARRVQAVAGVGVGPLHPQHLHGIGLLGFHGVAHGVAVGHADEGLGLGLLALQLLQRLVRALLGGGFGIGVHAGGRVPRIDLERVAHQKVGARTVDVAADGHEVAHGQARMHGVHLRVEGKAPLDGAALCIRVHAGGARRWSPRPRRSPSKPMRACSPSGRCCRWERPGSPSARRSRRTTDPRTRGR